MIIIKKILNALLTLLLAVSLIACSKDGEDSFGIDETTKQAFSTGLEVSADGESVELLFDSNINWESRLVFEDDNQNWCTVTHDYNGGINRITLFIAPNEIIKNRSAIFQLTSGKTIRTVNITQKGANVIIPERTLYTLGRDGGSFDVVYQAREECLSQLRFDGAEWIDFVSTEKKNDNTYILHFDVQNNVELGRMAHLLIYNNTTLTNEVNIEIRQEPRLFKSIEEINGVKEGKLAIILGSDDSNYHRIEELSLNASLNGDDIKALQKLFDKQSGSQLKKLDISASYFYAPLKDEIPANMFSDNNRIEEIKIPYSVRVIGSGAFRQCAGLSKIFIPIGVEKIESYAFFNCENLTKIDFDTESSLKRIGSYAFSTGSQIESVTLPETLTEFDGSSFAGMNAKELHIKWETPPVMKQYGSKQNTTLYVPIGSVELYRNAEYWNKFGDIKEEYN